MKHRSYLDFLQDISRSIDLVLDFTHGMKRSQLEKDVKTLYAVVKAFEIIGEATKRIPPAIRRKHADVPWKDMAGMRDVLIHDYFGLNLNIMWRTIKHDLPRLKPVIEKIRKESS